MSAWLVARPDFSRSLVVQAESAQEAFDKASLSFSVFEIAQGATRCVWRLGGFPLMFHVTYDGDPLTEAHGSTGARKITRPLGRKPQA